MKRQHLLILGGIAFVLGAVISFALFGRTEEAKTYGGSFFPRNCYLTNYQTGGDRGEVEPTTATTSQILIKQASVESATTTLVCDMAGANGFDLNLLYFSTNTPSTLNFTYEYSDDTTNCNATTTESQCNWFGFRGRTTATSSTFVNDFTLNQSERYFATGTVHQLPIRTRATTTITFLGERDFFHRWLRIGFKPSDADTMRLWVQVLLREPR